VSMRCQGCRPRSGRNCQFRSRIRGCLLARPPYPLPSAGWLYYPRSSRVVPGAASTLRWQKAKCGGRPWSLR
jgi:hypothetical protein